MKTAVEFWANAEIQEAIMALIDDLSESLVEDLDEHLPPILPLILDILHNDVSPSRAITFRALRTLETLAFNGNLCGSMSSVLSSLCSVFARTTRVPGSADGTPLTVFQGITHVLKVLCEYTEISDHVCRVLQPLSRLVKIHEGLRPDVLEILCSLVSTLGSSFLIYTPLITTILSLCRDIKNKSILNKYQVSASKLLKQIQQRRIDTLTMAGCQVVGRDNFQDALDAILTFNTNPDTPDFKLDQSQSPVIYSKPPISSRSEGPHSLRKNSRGDVARLGGRNNKRKRRLSNKQPVVRKDLKLQVNQRNLQQAWNATKRHRREDWLQWIRGFSIELLKESPSPALRACSELARKYGPLWRELFNPAFISCWMELEDKLQDELIYHLEFAIQATNIPPEVVQHLLQLVEFMEKQGRPLLMDVRILTSLAGRFHAFAKALYYREQGFLSDPSGSIEELISINNHLQESESAQGLLKYARNYNLAELKTSWYEKLEHWNEALEAYELHQLQDPGSIDCMLSRARCYDALGEYDKAVVLCKTLWQVPNEELKTAVAPLAATGAWNLSQWSWFEELIQRMNCDDEEGSFFSALHAVHMNDFKRANDFIDRARQALDLELRALLGEGYIRSYRVIVKVQQLAELEEVIRYKQAESEQRLDTMANIKQTWSRRLQGIRKKVSVWRHILSVRQLVISPRDDIETWSRYANLCRKSGQLELSARVLTRLLGHDPLDLAFNPNLTLPNQHPQVTMTCLSHLWAAGYYRQAIERISQLIASQFFSSSQGTIKKVRGGHLNLLEVYKQTERETQIRRLQSRCHLKRGNWELELFEMSRDNFDLEEDTRIPLEAKSLLMPSTRDEKSYAATVQRVIESYQSATRCDPRNQRAWQAWALMNYQVIMRYQKRDRSDLALHRVVPAIQGFFTSIQLQRKGQRLQDILRLLHLWFEHGSRPHVQRVLVHRFESISIDVWLDVIPQLIARIQTSDAANRKLVHDLLVRIGKGHPQALVYPLAVASKSSSRRRRCAAEDILDMMRQHDPMLVEQALLVSRELIRVAILWHEQWQEAIEEASRMWFDEKNFRAMYTQTLLPLHKKLLAGPRTVHEQQFVAKFGQLLHMANERCKDYAEHERPDDMKRAWDYYSTAFRKMTKDIQKMTNLELHQVSPKLLTASDMILAVPGTYEVGKPVVKIYNFVPTLKVIDSKQHPRKLKVMGSDGHEYTFLLKGHEDLRQDERVMQLFGLVNSFLGQDRDIGHHKDLSIRRYSVIPLSVQSGLIEWVPHCDTIHLLIKEYRDRQKILLNIEQRIMVNMAPSYQTLSLIQKIEVFQKALNDTKGNDLAKIFRLQSHSAESWLKRRSNYTRSLAVMSMVGYILGLGDRHPCNLMLCRRTGKIVHIDFGDCFEVAMHREKFPEKIPFRLTRMLVNAMEVSGIEGIFRHTCESVMRVLRDNKESVMAVLEAFVYDPLINWRLLDSKQEYSDHNQESDGDSSASTDDEAESSALCDRNEKAKRYQKPIPAAQNAETKQQEQKQRQRRARNLLRPDLDESQNHRGSIVRAMIGLHDRNLNREAVRVVTRVENKLTGRDFGALGHTVLDVSTQVQKLIHQATSHKNLCQCYMGGVPSGDTKN
eukprot:CAMPEP_0184486668 /NCGR_PEP_ID=MMETSP0113_2-20130426/8143_1 /TAXON_ID=91329 /ORGANISM="Norrisiella sphaerica, Strain BC52" /LENGTH=1615 /DNA_ID=CAMNT_0026868649 /DNA_START=27 /DNA_END=4875 /DNA_ORIENTATION=+